jgi:hypothetical protein
MEIAFGSWEREVGLWFGVDPEPNRNVDADQRTITEPSSEQAEHG